MEIAISAFHADFREAQSKSTVMVDAMSQYFRLRGSNVHFYAVPVSDSIVPVQSQVQVMQDLFYEHRVPQRDVEAEAEEVNEDVVEEPLPQMQIQTQEQMQTQMQEQIQEPMKFLFVHFMVFQSSS